MKVLFALLKKDLLSELRSRETLVVLFSLSLLLSVILSLGIQSAYLRAGQVEALLPAALWVVFLMAATVSVSRSYDYEQANCALQGLLLAGTSPWKIYISKVVITSIIMLAGQCITLASLGILLNISLFSDLITLIIISFLVIIGYAALSSLLAAMTMTARLRDLLLPLILLPLLFPLFFSALELTADIVVDQNFDPGSVWLSLLIGLDLLYILFGINLYEFVVRE
ncbi:MAG: hypothetical protein D6719_09405 [Candidatus Dadabacteria bacterium]|nr:MAG: hypothetical protein D6719_09405 [Candidatus Dadabacteria bacterium]